MDKTIVQKSVGQGKGSAKLVSLETTRIVSGRNLKSSEGDVDSTLIVNQKPAISSTPNAGLEALPANTKSQSVEAESIAEAHLDQDSQFGLESRFGIGTILKDRFELVDVLGVGGMGVVYKARDLRQLEAGETDPWLAVKVLNDELANEEFAIATLQQECKKSQRLAHPNIVNVHDFDRDQDTVFMTMECLEGTSLDEIIHEPGFRGLPLEQVVSILEDVGEALQYAHFQGVIHSDLKPSNIFITQQGKAKIFDFGIARAMHAVQSHGDESVIAFTPAYASIGILKNLDPHPTDDLYAFACVIYVLLTGQHPYRRQPADAVKQAGAKPAVIASLDRLQWRVLRQALQPLERNKLEVHAVLQAFSEEKPHSVIRTWMLWLSVVVIVVLIGWQYMANHQIDTVIAGLSAGDIEKIRHSLAVFSDLNPDEKARVLESSREPLIEFVTGQIASAIDTDKYDQASELLEELKGAYPDSVTLTQMKQGFEQQRRARASVLLEALRKFVSTKNGFDEVQISNITQTVATLKTVDLGLYLDLKQSLVADLAKLANTGLYENKLVFVKDLLATVQTIIPDETRFDLIAQRLQRYQQQTESAGGNLASRGLSHTRLSAGGKSRPLHDDEVLQLADLGRQFESATDTLDIRYQAWHRGLARIDSEYAANAELAIQQFFRDRFQAARSKPALAAEYQKVGRIVEADNPLYQEQKKVVDPCGKWLQGKGSLTKFQCRDKLTPSASGPALAVLPSNRKLAPFAISASEITVADYNVYCRLYRKCQRQTSDSNLPVTNISFAAANDYVNWLSAMSGQRYSIPTYSQWLYAALADGVELLPDHNCVVRQGSKILRGNSIRVTGLGQHNAWGLRDTQGNAAEWVMDAGQIKLAGGDFNTAIGDCQPSYAINDNGSPAQTKGFRVVRLLN